MFNKAILTAGTFILSIFVFMAASELDTDTHDNQEFNEEELSGEVIDAQTEEGIPNVTVYLKNGDSNSGQTDRTTTTTQNQNTAAADSTTTDQSGEFAFNNVENGSYTLEVDPTDYEKEEKEVEVKEDRKMNEESEKDKDKIQIELQPEY